MQTMKLEDHPRSYTIGIMTLKVNADGTGETIVGETRKTHEFPADCQDVGQRRDFLIAKGRELLQNSLRYYEETAKEYGVIFNE